MAKILFASMPFDGHFGPLTGLAVHLKGRGHDVRFYTGPTYGAKLDALGIPHFCFRRAVDVNHHNLVQHFPEYGTLGAGPKAIEFALTKVFFANLEAHLADVTELRDGFPFDALICDAAFYAADLIAQKLQPRVYAVHPAPTPASKSLRQPPPFLGLRPMRGPFGRVRDRVAWAMVESATRSGKALFNELCARQGLKGMGPRDSVFDLPYRHARAMFQVGVPSMDYPRADLPACQKFVGPLLPFKKPRSAGFAQEERLRAAPTVLAVSQGTVDNRDPEKLFVPALEAFAGGPHLVVVTTGGRHTEALRARFPQDNVIIEDWIDFDRLFEHTDVFICNGGYGSILLALASGVPVLSAGKLEGKNDINARLDWRGLGVDLRTERPTPKQLARGLDRVLKDTRLRQNVARAQAELASYRPFEIIESTLAADGIIARADPADHH